MKTTVQSWWIQEGWWLFSGWSVIWIMLFAAHTFSAPALRGLRHLSHKSKFQWDEQACLSLTQDIWWFLMRDEWTFKRWNIQISKALVYFVQFLYNEVWLGIAPLLVLHKVTISVQGCTKLEWCICIQCIHGAAYWSEGVWGERKKEVGYKRSGRNAGTVSI